MSDSGISVVSSQNSTVLLASSEPSLFRIPNSFPPKFVSSKPDVPIASKTDAVQAVHNSVVMAHQVSVTTHCILVSIFSYRLQLLKSMCGLIPFVD